MSISGRAVSGHVTCESPGHRADTGHSGHNHCHSHRSNRQDTINNVEDDYADNNGNVRVNIDGDHSDTTRWTSAPQLGVLNQARPGQCSVKRRELSM